MVDRGVRVGGGSCWDAAGQPSAAIYACHSCHGWEEKGGVSLDGDRLRALYETQQIMLREGLLTMAGRR